LPIDFLAADTKSGFFEIAHGGLDRLLLDEVRCNQLRRTKRGNPHKSMIANPQEQGVKFEECAVTARANG
jgi:hypothetical protein